MTASSVAGSSGSGATTRRPRRREGRGNRGRPRRGTGWKRPARRGRKTANRGLEQAGRAERIDCRNLASLRDEAYQAGDLERAAELSREPNVHLGPEGYRTLRRGGASETVEQAGRVERRNAADRGERDADSRQVERLQREITGIEVHS